MDDEVVKLFFTVLLVKWCPLGGKGLEARIAAKNKNKNWFLYIIGNNIIYGCKSNYNCIKWLFENQRSEKWALECLFRVPNYNLRHKEASCV